MISRTDLALEAKEKLGENIEGVEFMKENIEDVVVTRIKVISDQASIEIGKPKGDYITVEVPNLTDDFHNMEGRLRLVAQEIKSLIPEEGLVLVIGIGNSEITPDALGPKTAGVVLATRHITPDLARSMNLTNLRSVAVLSPGVLGQTGIETGEFILGVIKKIEPKVVIVIDALASQETKRLGSTIQISNTGICPGSGIGNARPQINEETMGVPVISLGVPTVVDAATLAADLLQLSDDEQLKNLKDKISPRGEPMMVTPREIDILIERAAKLTGMAINCALHNGFSTEDLLSLID